MNNQLPVLLMIEKARPNMRNKYNKTPKYVYLGYEERIRLQKEVNYFQFVIDKPDGTKTIMGLELIAVNKVTHFNITT